MANSSHPLPTATMSPAAPSSPPRQPRMKKRVSLFGLKRRGSEGSATSDGSEVQPPTTTAASHRPASPAQTLPRARKVVSPPPPLPISVSSPPTSPVRWTGNGKPPTARTNTTPTSATFTFPTAPPTEDVTAGLDDFAALRSHHNTLPRASRRDSFESPAGGVTHHLGAPFMYDGVSASASGASRRPRSGSAPARHSRVRSHFSIPDVVVTSCEEEGEETHFEVKLQDEKRRTRLPTSPASDGDSPSQPQSSASRRSLGNIIKPLLGFDNEGSVLGLSGAGGADAAFSDPSQQEQRVGTHTGAVVATVGPPAKRTRKTSLPMLFGRGSKGAKTADDAVAAPPPPRSSSPYSQTAFDSSGSLPSSSSRDSLHSSASSVPHSPPGDVDLVTPPDTPASAAVSTKRAYAKTGATTPIAVLAAQSKMATPSLSKKEQRKLREKEELSRKQREREEVMLMRELARVDKMVRQHDAKANKLRAKEEKLKSAADGAGAGTGKLPKALRRMTMFSGGSKTAGGSASQPAASAGLPAPTNGGGLVRKVSTGRRGGGVAGQNASTSAAPTRPRRPPPLYNNVAEQQQQQQQQAAPIVSAPTRSKDSDESERLSFSPQEWADLPQFLENNAYSSTVGSSAGLTSLAGLVEDMSLDLESSPAQSQSAAAAAPMSRRRSKRRSAMAANRGSMAILDGSGSSTPSSGGDSRRSSASMTTLTRRRSHLLGHKETPEVEEEGWVESGEEEGEAGETSAAQTATPSASESRCATPLASSINKAHGAHGQRYQSDPSAYLPRRAMPPSNSDPTIVASTTRAQRTSPEPSSAPPTTMSFNVGQVIPGSQATRDFPPLAECVEREVRQKSGMRDGASSVSPPLVPVVSVRSQSPLISAAFMR